LAVIETDGGLAVPLDGRPSTHILKLPNPDFEGLVENEALTLSLARAVGLAVVDHDVVTLGETRLLLVARYDREVKDGQVSRLHQQDLCQATGLPPDTKYESEGGPSLHTVFDLVREEVADPLTAARHILEWVVFNVLVHNADAHAKNVSILRTADGQHELAPFYDLVCTGAYAFDHRMAMSVGGQFDPGAVNMNNWVQLASDIGIGKSLVLRTVGELADRIPEVLDGEMTRLQDQLGRIPRRQQMEHTIKRRVKKTLDLLG
jgi:serine/threonine-protein kinase HipA